MHCWWCHVMIMWSPTWLTWLWSCDLVHLKSWFIALRSCSAWSSGKISNSIEGKEILHLMEMTVVSESISLYSPRETHPISNMTHTICQNLQKKAQNFGIRILSDFKCKKTFRWYCRLVILWTLSLDLLQRVPIFQTKTSLVLVHRSLFSLHAFESKVSIIW